jgi:uncharacterized protein YukE
MGMDVDLVEEKGRALKADAEKIAQLVRQIDALVRRLQAMWDGQDGRDFVNTWWPRHKQSLLLCVDGVSGLGQSALNNASEQRQVSSSSPDGGSNARLTSVEAQHLDQLADLAMLSKATYHDSSPVPPGYTEVSSEEIRALGLDPRLFQDNVSGFQATLYRDPNGTYVLAYRGSDAISSAQNDWVDDAASATGVVTGQEREAVLLAKALHQAVSADGGNLTFTGVSLGGGLAALASVATGDHATTYNARGVSLEAAVYAKSGVDLSTPGRAANIMTGMPGEAQIASLVEDGTRDAMLHLQPGQITSVVDANDPLNRLQDNHVSIGSVETNTSMGDRITVSTFHGPFDLHAHDVDGIIATLNENANAADGSAGVGAGGGGGGGGGF